MPLYRPSELFDFLTQNGVNPKKALSQNFLIDGNVLKKIIDNSSITPGETILEIGPGPGALTEQLLNAKAHVVAVEKDRELCTLLPRIEKGSGTLSVYNQDIMTFPIEEHIKSILPASEKAKVIANLPYHLTTPILEQIIPMNGIFSKIIVMVQDEVAKRFTAKPSTSDYGSFTVFLNYYSKPTYAFQVKRNSFHPAPKVDSAIVIFDLQKPPEIKDPTKFFQLTRTAFQQRRKMLKSSLKPLYPKEIIEECLTELNFNLLARPEDLSLDQFITFYELIQQKV